MILLSVASSIIISKFINDTIDVYTHRDKIFLLNDTNKNLSVIAFISIFIYFQTIHKYNIDISY